MRWRYGRFIAIMSLALELAVSAPARSQSGLLFHASADRSLTAEEAIGEPKPLFADKVRLVADGAIGGAIHADDDQILAWSAPGNVYAQRGTITFFWRSREPVGHNPFPIFRIGYPDHSSWDMVFLRVDWNGHGFDAFVTDTGLARTRVSFTLPHPLAADAWTHLALSWDETSGIRLYVDGVLAGRQDRVADYDSALYAFGPHSRTISGLQVQSAYNFLRGGDIDEIRSYDHMLDAHEVAVLARKEEPSVAPMTPRDLNLPVWRSEWLTRFGFTPGAAPYLSAPSTRIRKVEFTDARDWKAKFWKGTDGIRETTWPGVYNRSRLPGRHDYFELPDWNVYAAGGRDFDLTLPDEPWNRVEVQGAADGSLSWTQGSGRGAVIGTRPAGALRTTLQLTSERRGGKLAFHNRLPETPIQEIAAYDVTPGTAPADALALSYSIRPSAAADYPTLAELNAHIRGRYPADERATVVALPDGAAESRRPAAPPRSMPLVHILIAADFRQQPVGQPVGHFSYGWENLDQGLDGVALDLPAMTLKPGPDGLIPLNIRIKDPLWPDRDLLDVNVSVKPAEARSLWLDTRDRMLPPGRSLYIAIASAGADFGPAALDGTRVRLIFKPRAAATPEHIADRFDQIRGELAFFVEEQPNTRLLPVFERWDREMSDLLRIQPDHALARIYWNEQNGEQPYPAFAEPALPAGVPLWVFRQLEDLKLVEHFVNWWIDERQIPNGEFGGGLSDDTDLLHQWPALALMGSTPDKITTSQNRALDAVFANGMITNGLNTIHADELHSYEEGINAEAQAMTLSWGSPKAVERLMATARNYDRLTAVNAAGHRHFVTNYFSATDVVREGPWQWQKPPNFLILHPGLQLVQYNGSPVVRKLILELADGYLAHGRTSPDGRFTMPTQIYWPTDADKTIGSVGSGGGIGPASSIFWAAYRWTGDAKYLKPIVAEGDTSLIALGADVISTLGLQDSWGKAMQKVAEGPDTYRPSNTGGAGSMVSFARHVAWQMTGDKRYLEALYGREVATGSQRLYMMTEGHLWTDRVQMPNEMLQRERLGGLAARRNQTYAGNVVAWRFAGPVPADSVAVLIPQATPTHFKVIAFNTADQPAQATLIGADIEAGTWRLTSGADRDDNDAADAPTTRLIDFERTAELPLTLAPRQATVLDFTLETRSAPTWTRPDVGIDPEDVKRARGGLTVTVHGLGATASPQGQVEVEDAAGRVIARAPLPSVAAPADLLPKTVQVRVVLPGGAAAATRVRLRLNGNVAEVTRANNVASVLH